MNQEFDNYTASILGESLGLDVRVQTISNYIHILVAESPLTPYTRDALLDAIDRVLARPGLRSGSADTIHVYFQSPLTGKYLWEAEFTRGKYWSDIPVPPPLADGSQADPVSETEKQINTILMGYLNMGARVEIFQNTCHISLFSNSPRYDKGFILECIDRQLTRFKSAGISRVRVSFKFTGKNNNEWEISFEPGEYLSKAPPVTELTGTSPYTAVEKQMEGYLKRYLGLDTKIRLEKDSCLVGISSDTSEYTKEILLDALDRRLQGFDSYLAGKKISVEYYNKLSGKSSAVFDFGYYAYNRDKTAGLTKQMGNMTPEKQLETRCDELAEVIRQHLGIEAKVNISGTTCHIQLNSGYESDRTLLLNGVDRRVSKFCSQVSIPISSLHVYLSIGGIPIWEEEFEAGYYMNINKAKREKNYRDPFGF